MKFKAFLLLLGDIGVLYGSLALTLYLRHRLVPFSDYWAHHVVPFSIIFVIWLSVFYFHELYSRDAFRINTNFFATLVQAMITNGMLAIAFFYLSGAFLITPKTNLLIFSAFFFLLFVSWRALFADIIRGRDSYLRVAFLGLSAGEEKDVAIAITSCDKLMIQVPYNDFEFDILIASEESFKTQEVLIYDSIVRGKEVLDLVSFLESATTKVPIPLASTSWFINKYSLIKDKDYLLMKRVFDVALSLLLIIIFSIPVIFLCFAIKLSSKGPVFYKQIRTGKNGTKYVLYKLRSMTIDAEADGPQWSQKNDSRVTKIGRILRHTHLDELPQLWNILVGEMSFVGPRPERPEIIKVLVKEIPFYSLRHLVKPGVTGWAQINYPYGASIEDSKNKLAFDLYYIKHRTFFWDIRIIVKTLATIIRGEGR